MRMQVSTEHGREEVSGVLLAQTSSRRFSHRHEGGHAVPGEPCSACRWTRITIVRDEETVENGRYAVAVEGFSVVPGEITTGRVERTSSPVWVVEWLHRKKSGREPYLTTVAKNALLMAMQYDEKLAEYCKQRSIG